MAIFHRKKTPDITPRRRLVDTPRNSRPSLLEQQSNLFKRNRTLTGSISSQVASATEANGALKSSRVHAHELTHQRRRIGVVLLFVVAAAALVTILLTQLTATVTVAIPQVKSLDTSTYEQDIQQYLTEHPFERLRFALDLGRLTEYLRAKAPEVDTVTDVTPGGLGTTQISLRLRTPIVGWKIGDKQYYVDARGVSFSKNYLSPPAVTIVDQSGVQLAQGSAVASNRFLSYVGRTVALAREQKLEVQQVIIPLGTTREIELHIKGYSYPVRLSIDRGVGEQVEDMARAIQYFTRTGQTPQYIDVRVANKAYYR